MKKLSIVLIAAACLLGACKKEDQKEKVVLGTAIEEVNSNQKAYIDGQNYICFAIDDVVKVNNEDARITADGRNGNISVTRDNSYNAFYPKRILNQQNTAVPTTNVQVVLPSEQTYKEKSMGGVLRQVVDMPMVGYLNGTSGTIQFRNLCSVLRIIIHNDKTVTLGIKRITVRSSHAKLCGSGTIADITVAKPQIVMTSTSTVEDEVSLQMTNAVNVAPNNKKEFYIVIPAIPGDANNNPNRFTVEVVADSLVNNVSCGTFRYSKTQGSNRTGYIPRNQLGSAAFHLDPTTPPDYPYLILDCGSSSTSKRVIVAPGNLQYQASTQTWRFAQNSYEFLAGTWSGGNLSGYSTSGNNTAYDNRKTQAAWIDLFGWGTSGLAQQSSYPTGYSHLYMPWAYDYWQSYHNNYSYNQYYGPASGDLTSTNWDWGANSIYNPKSNKKETGWYTPSKDEWECLIQNNTKYGYACFKDTKYTDISGKERYAISGIVLLPEGFIDPELCIEHHEITQIRYDGYGEVTDITTKKVSSGNAAFMTSSQFSTEGFFQNNMYNSSDWARMEAAGAVFIPAAGTRMGTSVGGAGVESLVAQYWSCTNCNDYRQAYCMRTENITNKVRSDYKSIRSAGCAVRLFKEVQ